MTDTPDYTQKELVDALYGTGLESLVAGKAVASFPKNKQVVGKKNPLLDFARRYRSSARKPTEAEATDIGNEAMMARRSAIAGLGFDPHQMMFMPDAGNRMDDLLGNMESFNDNVPQAAGLTIKPYDPPPNPPDLPIADYPGDFPAYANLSYSGTAAHEAAHRGFGIMDRAGVPGTLSRETEEALVGRLEEHMGVPTSSRAYTPEELVPKLDRLLGAGNEWGSYEYDAAKTFAKRHPGGPR